MEKNQINTTPQCSIVIHEDVSEAKSIGAMPCPLCKSKLRLYQIHYDEKFLMCGNINCVYPFGQSDCHIYKIECKEEVIRNDKSSASSITSESMTSNSDWSEMDRMLTNIDRSLSVNDTPPPSLVDKPHNMEKLEYLKNKEKREESIRQNVKKIKELNKQLCERDEVLDGINNDKWIKQIAQMQERSGVQLLKENELKKVKTTIPIFGEGELKIDIDSTNNQICLKIGVDIENKDK